MRHRCLWASSFLCASALSLSAQSGPVAILTQVLLQQQIEAEHPEAFGVLPNRFQPTTADEIRANLPIPDAPLWQELPAGAVSAASLRHKVPKDAQKHFDRALGFLRDRDFARAVDALKECLTADPGFAEAHARLGVEYLRSGQDGKAEEELLASVRLDDRQTFVHSNLAAAQLRLGKWAAAETSARRALALSGQNDRARFILGALLVKSPLTQDEGKRHLERAARTIPAAKDLLGRTGDAR